VASHDRDRAVALSVRLAQAHQELRRQLDLLRTSIGQDALDRRTLVIHCLAFCTALTSHHRGEDAGMFADLLRARPDLAETVSKLVEDHEMIASILSRVAELAAEAAGSHGQRLDAIRLELDGLAAIMESHFGYEERAIGAALDRGVPDTGWSEMVFRLGDGAR
jgi:non-ribosomal peptide synthetase component F